MTKSLAKKIKNLSARRLIFPHKVYKYNFTKQFNETYTYFSFSLNIIKIQVVPSCFPVSNSKGRIYNHLCLFFETI